MVWRTTLITISTCFLLGTTFTHWIADHNVLWASPTTEEALLTSISYYSLLSTAPHGLGWAYIAVGTIAILSAAGRMWKVFATGRGEVVFDGGSVVLLAAITYTQLSEVFPAILLFPTPLPAKLTSTPFYPILSSAARELASDNIKTAVMLTGVMALQCGRYYAKRPSRSVQQLSSLPLPDMDSSAPSTPPRSDDEEVPRKQPVSPIAGRAATPFRELSEEEAMELRAMQGEVSKAGLGLPMTGHNGKIRKR